MAVPSKIWTSIADTQIDADSPLDTTLLTEIRDNLVYLQEWLGLSYNAAQDHNHDGVNSAPVLSAQLLLLDTEYSVSVSAWTMVDRSRLYIPSNAGALEYVAYIYSASGNPVEMRLASGATSGTAIQTTSTTYTWGTGTGAIDVSAMSGWVQFDIQMRWTSGPSETAYIRKAYCRVI